MTVNTKANGMYSLGTAFVDGIRVSVFPVACLFFNFTF